jgi:hypothetical protein
MHLSVLLIAVLAFYSISFGTQVYGSTDSTNQCDLPANRSCPQISSNSQVKSGSESETAQTPLILPDLSPTREDLNNAQADESTKTVGSNDNDDTTSTTLTSTSTESGDNDVVENNDADNSGDEETNDREDEDGDDSGDGPSMIPFP